jgi:glycerol dehydrogenase
MVWIGVAHAIHNSMTHQQAFHHWLHGEKVGYGLAVQAILQHRDPVDREAAAGLAAADGGAADACRAAWGSGDPRPCWQALRQG